MSMVVRAEKEGLAAIDRTSCRILKIRSGAHYCESKMAETKTKLIVSVD